MNLSIGVRPVRANGQSGVYGQQRIGHRRDRAGDLTSGYTGVHWAQADLLKGAGVDAAVEGIVEAYRTRANVAPDRPVGTIGFEASLAQTK